MTFLSKINSALQKINSFLTKINKKLRISLFDVVQINIIAVLIALFAVHMSREQPSYILSGVIGAQAIIQIIEVTTRKLKIRDEIVPTKRKPKANRDQPRRNPTT